MNDSRLATCRLTSTRTHSHTHLYTHTRKLTSVRRAKVPLSRQHSAAVTGHHNLRTLSLSLSHAHTHTHAGSQVYGTKKYHSVGNILQQSLVITAFALSLSLSLSHTCTHAHTRRLTSVRRSKVPLSRQHSAAVTGHHSLRTHPHQRFVVFCRFNFSSLGHRSRNRRQ